MDSSRADQRQEPKAKAALLEFLRSRKLLKRGAAVTAELILGKQTVRADIAVCDKADLHCFEIKTARDNLARLDKQIEEYSRHAAFVTVVAHSRHINSVISRVDPHVGIFELMPFPCETQIRVVREPTRSPCVSVDLMLSILPVTEILSRLQIAGRLRRREAILKAASIPDPLKKQAVLDFFAERYGPNSVNFIRTTRRRLIKPEDLAMLRRWQFSASDKLDDVQTRCSEANLRRDIDADLYRHIGLSFSPVPEDVRELLAD